VQDDEGEKVGRVGLVRHIETCHVVRKRAMCE